MDGQGRNWKSGVSWRGKHAYQVGKVLALLLFSMDTIENFRYPLVIASRFNCPFLLDLPNINNAKNIQGEIYEIDVQKLKHLDILEDYPKLYTRRKERIRITNMPVLITELNV